MFMDEITKIPSKVARKKTTRRQTFRYFRCESQNKNVHYDVHNCLFCDLNADSQKTQNGFSVESTIKPSFFGHLSLFFAFFRF